MQYDPNKQGFNNYGNVYSNQYGPTNPPAYGAGGGYMPNNPPPAYPQQPGYPVPGAPYPGSQPMQPQYVVTGAPVVRPVWWNNVLLTPITPSFRTFLVISGIFYILWAVVVVGLEIGIILNSSWRYYTGFWSGGFLLGGGISMLIASCRPSYVIARLIQMYSICLFLCILGSILSVINLTRSTLCDPPFYWYYCDDELAHHLKIAIIVACVIATIHTIVNIVVSTNARRAAATLPASCPQ